MYHETINSATNRYPFLIEHQNVKYIPHFHEETELLMVLEGRLYVTVEDRSYTLSQGEIGVIASGLIHNLYSLEPNRTFVMKLFPVEELRGIRLHREILTSSDAAYARIREAVDVIRRENEQRQIGYEMAVNCQVDGIGLWLLREAPHDCAEDKHMAQLEKKTRFFDTVTEFLHAHYADEFSLEDVAAYCNYTKSYFCHAFKRVTGVTFWHYYTIFRLEKSLQMMRECPKKKLIEIAGAGGFQNLRSFNQAFREYYRCTPREYAKKYYTAESFFDEEASPKA